MVRGCCFEYTFAYPSSKLYVITVSRPEILVKIFLSTSNISSGIRFQESCISTVQRLHYPFHLAKANKEMKIYYLFHNYLIKGRIKNVNNTKLLFMLLSLTVILYYYLLIKKSYLLREMYKYVVIKQMKHEEIFDS